MKIVPMVRATGLGTLPIVLEERSGTRDLVQSFRRFNVPLEIVENPKAFIPVRSMCGLFDHSARLLGDRCLGLGVGLNMAPQNFGMWLMYSAQARTLSDAIGRVERTCHHQMTGVRMYLERCPEISYWRYVSPTYAERGDHHTDHLIGPMIEFIRRLLGPEWKPEWVEVDYPADPLSHLVEEMLEVPVHFGADNLAIAIRSDEIDTVPNSRMPLANQSAITSADVLADRLTQSHQEPINSIFLTIMLRLIDGLTDIDGTARMMDLSLQQMQRTLRREGTCYRDLLDRAKLIRAQAMLKETDMTITEISLVLGYADNTGFSRSFRKLNGHTPTEYRKHTF